MAKQQLDTLTEPMYYILLALTEERHGYDIIKSTAGLTKGRVNLGAGTVYNLLKRFDEEGIVEKTKEEERRKLYRLTQKGRAILEEEYKRLSNQVSDGKEILKGASK